MTRAWLLLIVQLDASALPVGRWYLSLETCRAALVETISAHVLRDAWCQAVQLKPMRPVTMEGIER